MAWFSLNEGGNPLNPDDYTSGPTPTCGGQDQICAVQTNPDTSGKPQLTATLKDEMIEALHSGEESDNVKLKVRP